MDAIPDRLGRFLDGYLRDVARRIRIEKVVHFGSSAAACVDGRVDVTCDVDVAIFSEDFRGMKPIDAACLLLKLARHRGEFCLDPVAFLPEDLVSDNPFVNEILRTGREIRLACFLPGT